MQPSETPATPAVRCAGVAKTYVTGTGDVAALLDVNAAFPAGAFSAVAGPSGSGKSTLLRLLACVDRPDAGVVEVAGRDVTRLRARRRREMRRRTIGYVFQNPAANLLDYLTAAEHLRLAARLRGRAEDEEPGRLLEMVDLSHRAGHVPRGLSGGEQQRLAVASALAGGPAVLVADEPNAQLDHESGQHVVTALRRVTERGIGVVVASHDQEMIGAADRVFTLADGRLEEEAENRRETATIGRVTMSAEGSADNRAGSGREGFS